MHDLASSLSTHRVRQCDPSDVVDGRVHWEPVRSLWLTVMTLGATIGGAMTFTWGAFSVYVFSTATVLLLGHSLGMHRKLIHDSYQCPKWLEYFLVYCGVLVGLSGPLGLLRAHEMRDYAQRLPRCHGFLAHQQPFLLDGWWQLHCELRLARPPVVAIEQRITDDRIYCFLQRTWMLQQLPWALLLLWLGGWGFVCWGVCARVATGVTGHWLIGWFAHNRGDMHHEVRGACVQGRNIHLTSLLTMGECWHNNHHAFPGSARLGLYRGQWDPGWWTLLAMHRLGLAHGLRLPEHLPHRPELVACKRDNVGLSQVALHEPDTSLPWSRT